MDFKDYQFPAVMKGAIERYILYGMFPGDFLAAIIENDLKGAVANSDSRNINFIQDLVKFFFNETSSECWGRKNAMNEWNESLSKISN